VGSGFLFKSQEIKYSAERSKLDKAPTSEANGGVVTPMICSSWPCNGFSSNKNRGARQCQKRKLPPTNTFRNDSSFVCPGVSKKPVGSNVVIAEKSRVLKRLSKKDSALQRHVKWLKKLQDDKRQLDEQKSAEEERRLERKRLFIEREAKKRLEASAERIG
jgi:hypothetical protein